MSAWCPTWCPIGSREIIPDWPSVGAKGPAVDSAKGASPGIRWPITIIFFLIPSGPTGQPFIVVPTVPEHGGIASRLPGGDPASHAASRCGASWRISQEEAVAGIENGRWVFYVSQGGIVVRVIIAVSRYGQKYLKTEADGEQPDNLLSLPECR
jgi:hypothetical protein